MRFIPRLILPLLLGAISFGAPLAVHAQAPAAAPVPAVTTTAVPPAGGGYELTPVTPGIGMPSGGIGLQQPVSDIAREAHSMATGVLDPLMIAVAVFVLILLAYTVFRYRAARNPVASRTSHNTIVEVVWTVVPVLILVWIAVPSFRLLANQYSPPKADLTIKATGHQWYWEYEYPDQGGFSFDSIISTEAEAAKRGSPYQLDVDNRIVVPVGATVKVLTTAADVIHSFAVPSFWVKMDAVPGRINETWFKVDRPGVYFGQCSELCGTKHGFMPIAVEVVSKERFAAWVAMKQKENGISPAAGAAPRPAPVGGPAAPVAGAAEPAAPTVDAPAGAAVTGLPSTNSAAAATSPEAKLPVAPAAK